MCTVVVYDGIKSACAASGSSVKTYPSKFYCKRNIVDLYGCEQAFSGGFLSQLAQKSDMEICIDSGFFAASAIATQLGAHYPMNRVDLLLKWYEKELCRNREFGYLIIPKNITLVLQVLWTRIADGLSLEAYACASEQCGAEGADYQAVKRVLLQRFGCDRNGFRSKFLSVRPQDAEDFGTFINRARRYFDRWVELSGVTTLEGLAYLVCSEIALQACDEDFVAYIKDRSPSDMVSLKIVASAYIDARPNKSFRRKHAVSFSAKSEPYRPSIRAVDRRDNRNNWPRPHVGVSRSNYSSKGHRSPSFQGCSDAVKRGASRSPSRDRNKSNFNGKSVGQGQHFGPSSSSGSSLTPTHNVVTYYQCGGRGHVHRECPRLPKDANSAYSSPKLPSHCCAAKMSCDLRGRLKIEYCKASKASVDNGLPVSDTPTHFDVLAPFSDLPVRQREDPSLTPWFKRVGSPPVARVSFRIEDGVLKRLHAKSEFATVQTTIAVPESLRQVVLSYAHESDLAGHSGFRKTLSAIRDYFSWPGVCSDVKNYITSCHLCQIKPRTGRDRPAPFQPVPIVGEPFERVIIDLVGPLPLSSDRYEYLLMLVDVSTRWAEAVSQRRITAKDVAEALFFIFVSLGFPKEIQSDRGQQFMSNLLAEFNSLCNIKHFVSTPYHPQTNGIVERFHSTLKSMIRKRSRESPTEWNRLYLRHYLPTEDAVRDSVDESRLRHEPRSKLKHFVPGDEVLVLLPTSDSKLVLSYKGPYRVVEKRTRVVYLVDLGDRKCTFHVNLLRKYRRSTYPSPPSDNFVGVDSACSSQAFAGATSFCDPSVFPFSSLSTVEPSLCVNSVIDENLDSNHDSNLKFCETICFAEPTAYVSAISEEDDGEIGSLVTTPPLASESDTVDPSLSASQVPLHPDSRKYTAFQTPLGLMQWVRMPFGLVTAPATFCRLMRLVIGQTPDLLSYFDDTLVFVMSWQQHIVALRSLLVLLGRHGLHVNPSKVSIGSSFVEFLGHVVRSGTLVPVQKKMVKILQLSVPVKKKEVRSLLGLMNYYRHFIANFTSISAPLSDLLRKGTPEKVQWTPRCDQSLAEIKRLFSSPPILIIPDVQETFIVRSDASDFGIGAVLLQDREGIQMLCRYASRKLLSRERRYSAVPAILDF
ncbi:Pol polyprotein [Plakobranchus ocellatus]|uniref:Pol polyprotein n=1 Tax=Plakobranchus ocellatus TaxID=259542 RepID=A0AAV3YI30_9GAST|nr:Pol polyprotein [Plakobranchus ocellatus]